MNNSNQKIRMYNGVTYSVTEVLHLWAGKTVHCGSKIVGIEEMVRLTIETGSFNPSDLGGHAWGLNMELVSMSENKQRDSEIEDQLIADMKKVFWAHGASSRNLEAYFDFEDEFGSWGTCLIETMNQIVDYLNETNFRKQEYAKCLLQSELERGLRKYLKHRYEGFQHEKEFVVEIKKALQR